MSSTLIIATRNRHKVAEIRAILGSRFEYLSLEKFPEAPAVAEDADSFAGNASKKAAQLANWLLATEASATEGLAKPVFVLADDSGLEVDALGGAPAVHSARFAALDAGGVGNSPDAANNAKLLRLLAATPLEQRTARFRCVVALVEVPMAPPVPAPRLFEGACEGRIASVPRGRNGFGYDPLFVPAGHNQSFAQLGEEIKNRLSHRAQALKQLRSYLQGQPQTTDTPDAFRIGKE